MFNVPGAMRHRGQRTGVEVEVAVAVAVVGRRKRVCERG
jgi:hypothetical protein